MQLLSNNRKRKLLMLVNHTVVLSTNHESAHFNPSYRVFSFLNLSNHSFFFHFTHT